MESITLKNEFGETIELKRGLGGCTLIRHTDIDPVEFGVFRDLGDARGTLTEQGVDVNGPEMLAALKLFEALRGTHMELKRQRYILNENEVKMIREAVKQLG